MPGPRVRRRRRRLGTPCPTPIPPSRSNRGSEFAQRLSQGGGGVFLPHQAPPLQGRNQTLADFVDVLPADALERRRDQEAVSPDLVHHLAQVVGDAVRGADDAVEAPDGRILAELPQGLAAAPLREGVQRALLA